MRFENKNQILLFRKMEHFATNCCGSSSSYKKETTSLSNKQQQKRKENGKKKHLRKKTKQGSRQGHKELCRQPTTPRKRLSKQQGETQSLTAAPHSAPCLRTPSARQWPKDGRDFVFLTYQSEICKRHNTLQFLPESVNLEVCDASLSGLKNNKPFICVINFLE